MLAEIPDAIRMFPVWTPNLPVSRNTGKLGPNSRFPAFADVPGFAFSLEKAELPVIFPLLREKAAQRGSRQTASRTTESPKSCKSRCLRARTAESPQFCGVSVTAIPRCSRETPAQRLFSDEIWPPSPRAILLTAPELLRAFIRRRASPSAPASLLAVSRRAAGAASVVEDVVHQRSTARYPARARTDEPASSVDVGTAQAQAPGP